MCTNRSTKQPFNNIKEFGLTIIIYWPQSIISEFTARLIINDLIRFMTEACHYYSIYLYVCLYLIKSLITIGPA